MSLIDDVNIHFEFSDHLYVNNKFWTKAQIYQEIDIVRSITGPAFFGSGDTQAYVTQERAISFFTEYRVPEAWHMYLDGANWDCGGEHVLEWILEQDECDAGTALLALGLTYSIHSWGEMILCKAANGGFKRFKCPLKFDHKKYLRLVVEHNSHLDSEALDGIEILSGVSPEAITYDVPHTADETGLMVISHCYDFRGHLLDDVKRNGVKEEDRPNPASRLVFGVQ